MQTYNSEGTKPIQDSPNPASTHGLKVEYTKNLSLVERQYEVCIVGNKTGEYYGMLTMIQEQSGIMQVNVGIWLIVNITNENKVNIYRLQTKTCGNFPIRYECSEVSIFPSKRSNEDFDTLDQCQSHINKCPSGQTRCSDGVCRTDCGSYGICIASTCQNNEARCSDGVCRTDCSINQCPSGQTRCPDGICKTSCDSCSSGQILCPDGTCKTDCGCPSGTTLCSDGTCKADCNAKTNNSYIWIVLIVIGLIGVIYYFKNETHNKSLL